MKKKILFLFLFLLVIFRCTPAFAAEEFATAYEVKYEAVSLTIVHVSQQVTLTNKLSNIYAKEYSLTFVGTRIENISASDGLGEIKTEVGKKDDSTTITLFFNEQVVGTGKSLIFKLSYDALDLAKKTGQIWEINIPKLANVSPPENYTLTLSVPEKYGNLAYIRPQPVDRLQEAGSFIYRFTKNQILSTGINAVFGDFQVFNFNLSYHLENPNAVLGETEIALPPDTSFQKITYNKIDPPPKEIRLDEDGNWLAKYRLKAKERINIIASGQVKIFTQPIKDFIIPNQDTIQKNLLPQKYWESDNPELVAEAQKLKTSKNIYNFVTQRLDYDFERVKKGAERQGALQALKNPHSALCMEFTDLFIALARAAGIPSREINGFAFTDNEKLRPLSLVSDLLHSWPEYWDYERKIWVPVDPTWGKTTGGVDFFSKTDMNHFAFVIHGQDSQTPYPAGSYKIDDAYGKDIEVVFGDYQGEETSKVSVVFDLPEKILGEIETKGTLIVKNVGPVALYQVPIKIIPTGFTLLSPKSLEFSLDALPPFGEKMIELKLKPAPFLKLKTGVLEIEANNQLFVYNIKIVSLIWRYLVPLAGIILAFVIALFLTRKGFYVKKTSGER